jgi:hypothetical protein
MAYLEVWLSCYKNAEIIIDHCEERNKFTTQCYLIGIGSSEQHTNYTHTMSPFDFVFDDDELEEVKSEDTKK